MVINIRITGRLTHGRQIYSFSGGGKKIGHSTSRSQHCSPDPGKQLQHCLVKKKNCACKFFFDEINTVTSMLMAVVYDGITIDPCKDAERLGG